MKKRWIALAIASACIAPCLTACGEDYDGEYELYSIEYEGKTYRLGDTFEESVTLTGNSLAITLKETKGEKDEGTWMISGELSAWFAISGGLWEEEEKGVLELTPYGNKTEILTQCDGETLTLVLDGVTIVFKD